MPGYTTLRARTRQASSGEPWTVSQLRTGYCGARQTRFEAGTFYTHYMAERRRLNVVVFPILYLPYNGKNHENKIS